MRPPKCNCNESHKANASRAGRPISLWACPIHGNVWDEPSPDAALSSVQRMVLDSVKKLGIKATVDDLSRDTNLSMFSTQRAVNELSAAGLLKGD